MEVKKIAVLGAGLMGSGIAQVAAQAGFNVNLMDVAQQFVDKGLSTIEKNLKRVLEKGKMDAAQAEAVRKRISPFLSLADAAKDVDVVIEAVIEKMDLKKGVYTELETAARNDTIFASNTSALSITELASATKRPDRFIGMHFFNPVPVM